MNHSSERVHEITKKIDRYRAARRSSNARRASETSPERRARLKANADRVAAARARETSLERRERLRANARRVAAARARETPLQRKERLRANAERVAAARAAKLQYRQYVQSQITERRRRESDSQSNEESAEVAYYYDPEHQSQYCDNSCSLDSHSREEELEGIQERYVHALRSFLQHTSPHHPTRLHDLFARIPEIQAAAALLLESKMFYVPFVLNSAEVR